MTANSNIVKLNIGGTVFQTTKSTLSRFNGFFTTLLETGVPVAKDSSRIIFIDRDPKHFRLILNFMRDGHVELPESSELLKEIGNEAYYYLLDDLVELCNIKHSERVSKRKPMFLVQFLCTFVCVSIAFMFVSPCIPPKVAFTHINSTAFLETLEQTTNAFLGCKKKGVIVIIYPKENFDFSTQMAATAVKYRNEFDVYFNKGEESQERLTYKVYRKTDGHLFLFNRTDIRFDTWIKVWLR